MIDIKPTFANQVIDQKPQMGKPETTSSVYTVTNTLWSDTVIKWSDTVGVWAGGDNVQGGKPNNLGV